MARRGACQREGCDHYAAERSRVCQCCARQLGSRDADKLSLMRQFAADYDLARAEDEALTKLNTMPPRRPIGRGMSQLFHDGPNAPNQRRAEWRR
jgi:hypothetical protein